jgi:hypothetical protein
LRTGEGMSDTTLIGISFRTDATCVVEFESDDASECPVDDGNGPLHVTEDGLRTSRRISNRLVVDNIYISCSHHLALHIRGGTFDNTFIIDCARSFI